MERQLNSNLNRRPSGQNDGSLRDGIETLPEQLDIDGEVTLPKTTTEATDDDLTEALLETFPASDPLASGKFE
jgi:hypothetical protein